jgi:hypothetical protein
VAGKGFRDVTEPIRVSPWVTHERLDDEVIAINLETGAYYALDGVAADCWALTASGRETDDIVAVLTSRYDVDEAQLRADIDRFVAQLVAERLMVVGGDAEPVPAPELPPHAAKKAYTAPGIEKYDDLEDLLLLDPIHEVDEAGWPVARAD